MGDIIDIPTIAHPDGPGWRLRPTGRESRGIEDRDPRGRETGGRGRGPGVGGRGPEVGSRGPCVGGQACSVPYVELHCHSCYSFREGASTPRELVTRAADLRYEALAITDRDGLYGAMEFAKAAEVVGIRPIIGADVTLQGGYRLVLLAESREGYANLCTLLSEARLAEARVSPHPPSPSPQRGGGVKTGLGGVPPGPRPAGALDTPGRGFGSIGVRPESPNPRIRFSDLAQHTQGLIALSGDENGEVPSLITAGRLDRAAAAARRYAGWFGPGNFFIELQQTLTLGDTERNRRLVELAKGLGLGVVATNDVWYHVRERHRLHDVLVAVKNRTTLDGSHRFRHANGEHYLKSGAELVELFEVFTPPPSKGRGSKEGSGGCPPRPPAREGGNGPLPIPLPEGEGTGYGEAIRNTVAIAGRCRFNLASDLGYEFPHYPAPLGETPDSHLARICREALWRKYGRDEGRGSKERSGGFPPKSPSGLDVVPTQHYVEAAMRLDEELVLIEKHGLAGFFLAYYDLLKLAGGIAFELKGRDPNLTPDERPVGRGRGSSVSSIVCYLIGLSHVDPIANELFLGRFLNEEMNSVPDIDLDFPRDIREELLKRIWTVFDEGRAALVCAYATYHTKSAVRDVGKALGLPALELDHLAKLSDSWSSEGVEKEMERLPEYRAKIDAPLWRDLIDLSQQLIGLPRHVTQHVGGVVLSARPMQEIVPLEPTRMEGRVMCQWDKDSVDDARMVKIDFLALGMLSLVDECLDTIERRHGERPDLGRIPHDDPEIYDRICAGDTIGLFQIESRAQIATLPHTQPRNLDDLAVQVAIVRPGPIVGGAFKPYMEYRRLIREQAAGYDPHPSPLPEGEGTRRPALPPIPVKYIHECLEPVLRDTLGVVLYQEQVVQVAMAMAGFTAGEADRLRRNLGRRHGAELAEEDWPEFVRRARELDRPDEAIHAAFRSILGFASYGFPKSHAVAFGLLAYESAWLRYKYPAEYYAALFNNQPMGFYSTEVIAGDARRHSIELVRPDVNLSGAGCEVENDRRIRLGLAEVKGVGSAMALAIVVERDTGGPFGSLFNLVERTGLRPEAAEHLILAGALDGIGDRGQGTGDRGTALTLPLSQREREQAAAQRGRGQSPSRRDLLWQLGLLRAQGVQRTRIPQREGRGSGMPDPYGVKEGSKQRGGAMRQGALPFSLDQDLVALPPMSPWEETAAEYAIMGLAPAQQAMGLVRSALGTGILTSAQATDLPDGAIVRVAGLAVCRQRPSTAKGVLFVSLEDEYGIANLVVYPPLFERQRTLILGEPFLIARGRVQRQGTVVHIVAQHFERANVHSERLINVSHNFH